MTTIDKSKPILVTGATGYIAGWIIKKLLDQGLTVHAAVRNPDNNEKLAHLNELASNSNGKLSYFKTDLLDNGSYAEAMENCELVFHTPPFFYHVLTTLLLLSSIFHNSQELSGINDPRKNTRDFGEC